MKNYYFNKTKSSTYLRGGEKLCIQQKKEV